MTTPFYPGSRYCRVPVRTRVEPDGSPVQFVGAALVQRQQFRAQCGWEGQMHMAA